MIEVPLHATASGKGSETARASQGQGSVTLRPAKQVHENHVVGSSSAGTGGRREVQLGGNTSTSVRVEVWGRGGGGAERMGPTCGVVDEHLRCLLQAAVPFGEIVHVHCPKAEERRRVVVVLPRGGPG